LHSISVFLLIVVEPLDKFTVVDRQSMVANLAEHIAVIAEKLLVKGVVKSRRYMLSTSHDTSQKESRFVENPCIKLNSQEMKP
jgi:hypothetical protein